MDKLLGAEHPFERASSQGLKSSASFVELGERGRYAEMGHNANRTLIRQEHLAKLGLADRDGMLQHRLEHRLQLAKRAADYAQLLQCLGQIVGALAQLVEQTGVLNGNDRLRGEVGDQLDLFVRKRTDLLSVDGHRAD
jgi:hypothetical protein